MRIEWGQQGECCPKKDECAEWKGQKFAHCPKRNSPSLLQNAIRTLCGLECRDQLPANTFACSIAHKANQSVPLIAIEAFDRIVQAPLGRIIRMSRQGIIDSRRPVLLLEGHQNRFLHRRRELKNFY